LSMRKPLLLLAVLFFLLPALVTQAQAPDAINSALDDLSARVGHKVALSDLDNWTFEEKRFPDTSLGCPQPNTAYLQVVTVGLQFMLTYNGTAYDYRVSSDRRSVVLCNSTPATAVPAPCPPNDPAFLPPRLSIGIQARVEEGGFPNNIRDLPGASGKYMGEIPPGQTFTVVDGPRCSLLDKIIWWQVNYNGIIGWTAEGKDSDYWVEPLNANGTPAVPSKTPISVSNAVQVALLPGAQAVGVAALSPDGDKLAQVVNSTVQISYVASSQAASTFSGEATKAAVTALAFDSRGTALLVGYDDGTIRLVDTATNGALQQRLQMTGHTGAVNSLAFSPDGTLVVSGGADMSVRLWDARSGTSLAVLNGHRSPVVSVSFSTDGSTIMSKDNQGTVYLWRAASGAAG
jgi:WD40 domain-containing protein